MAPSNIPVLQECAPDGMMLNEEPGHTMAEYINGDHAADGVADHFTNGERVDGVQHGSKQMVDTEGHVVVDRTENAFVDGSLMGEDHVSNGFVSNSNGFVSKEQDNSNPMIESTSGKSASPLDIAICGMACRLPGGNHSPEQFWEFLVGKGDARCKVPSTRYNVDAYYSPSGKLGTVKTQHAYFLDDSIDLGSLDTSFFSMRRAEVDRADPHHRQMLEVARECFEDAGVTNWRGRSIGCYIGTFGEDWIDMIQKESQHYGTYRGGGHGDFMLPNRINYDMDLRGPSIIIRTACSSTLVALHEACQAISRGDCEGALVGGVNLIMAPYMTTTMTEQGVLSPDGSCKTFSKEANGYGRGEAVNAIFVKPLADALRDGNPVRAVIRSTACNSNGYSPAGFSAPHPEAQVAMIRRAYEVAGITNMLDTAFVECHGTGTLVGDPRETEAVSEVFGGSPDGIYIGSVKPNVGHSEGASGLTSVIKAVLALEHKILPPNINFFTPNPEIQWDKGLKVPTEATAWPKGRRERISVNSFGIGGSNAHVILDSAKSFGVRKPSTSKDSPQLLLFSGTSQESIRRLATEYNEYLGRHPAKLSDIAYTLANHREHLAQRSFAVARMHAPLRPSPIFKAGNQPPKLVMVFTGQGAQWPLMGRELFHDPDYPVFKQSIRRLDKYLQSARFRPDWTIEDELLHPPQLSRLNSAELSQPLCTALQIALVDTLTTLGVTPTAVVGHSSGEIAAAYAVGALTAREAIVVAFHRGIVSSRQAKAGAMAAVGMGFEDVSKFLRPGVVVACINSPKSVTISGDAQHVREVVSDIKNTEEDAFARLLKVDKAYHSHHMAEIGPAYRATIDKEITRKKPTALYFSSVTGHLLESEATLGPEYWQENLESPVLFQAAVTALLQHEDIGREPVLLEVGPHAALAGPLRQIQTQIGKQSTYASLLMRNEDCVETFLNALGTLHSARVGVNLKALIPHGTALSDLPRYPWKHDESHWFESRLSREWRLRRFPYHDLLGLRVNESTDLNPSWRNIFHVSNIDWIRDHIIVDTIVFPFSGYAAMVGEAIRQITGVEDSYHLRHIVASTALVLPDSKPTEILTSLRKLPLTDMLDSEWWEFTVASHNGQAWVKHCSGEARAGPATAEPGEPKGPLPRKVTTQKCYDTLRRSGQRFGHSFKALHDITSETMVELATAKADNSFSDKTSYHLHPVLMDTGMQVLGIAASRGFAVDLGFRMLVPTSIDDLKVFRTSSDIDITASANFNKVGGLFGRSTVVADGKVVMAIDGLRFTPFDDASRQDSGDLTAHIEWGPHLDFEKVGPLLQTASAHDEVLPVLNDLACLSMLSSLQIVQGIETDLPDMQRYVSWIRSQLHMSDRLPVLCGRVSSENLLKDPVSTQQSLEEIESLSVQLAAQLEKTAAFPAAQAIRMVCANFKNIYLGTQALSELLDVNNVLTKIYQFAQGLDMSALFRRMAFQNPHLRILEINAGSGSMTSAVIKNFVAADGRSMFSEYACTDSSADVLTAYKDNFKHAATINYSVLDVTQSLTDQGFSDRSFDFIIGSNVLCGNKSPRESLLNIHKLLGPSGRLVLAEHDSASPWMNYILGASPSLWAMEPNCTIEEKSSAQHERWEKELNDAGFDKLEKCVLDARPSYQASTVFFARPKTDMVPLRKATLLCHDVTCPGPVYQELLNRGYTVDSKTISDLPLPADQDILAVLDLTAPFFEQWQTDRFESFKQFTKSIQNSGIMWVTGPCQIKCKDPRYAQAIGVARNMRAEALLDFATCEVDDAEQSVGLIADVFTEFQLRQENDTFKPEMEYAIVEGTILVPRIFPFDLRSAQLMDEPDDITILSTPRPGRVDDLGWFKQARATLEGDALEVEPYASGLNFKDVLVAMGIVGASKEGFGLEAAGVVSRTGPSVKNIKVGDRVLYIGYGTFASHSVVSEDLCAKMPDDLSFEDAATMPCVYTTSIYSLFHVGMLEKGQSVLIHSAAGGIGVSSIQLARMIGAEVFATVGSEEKVDFLMKTFGLARNRIFNSRTSSFVQEIMRETDGRGVDLALNSLSGELLHATWKCIAKFGRLVEIGKRDLLGNGKLDMNPFLDNRSYSCVDLDQLSYVKPAVVKELLEKTMSYYRDGHIRPIRPINVIPASKIASAFRTMQQGQHMGKIVIRMRDDAHQLDVGDAIQRRHRFAEFDSTGYYLLVGGLGGLGRSISIAMVERGARRFIYLSRSAADAEQYRDFIRELQSMGCEAKMIPGSVSNIEDVRRSVAAADGQLKGVLQLSMVLRDQGFQQMTFEEWTTVVSPKVDGTWNLHEATLEEQLDFFLLFSSLSGQFGTPGQANYASANTFLDAFVQYRSHLGRPASVIDIGPVQEIGYIARNEKLLQSLQARDLLGNISQSALLECVEAAIACFPSAPDDPITPGATFASRRLTTLGIETAVPLSSPENRVLWKKDIRMAVYHNQTEDSSANAGSASDALRMFVVRAKHEIDTLRSPETATYFATEIGKKIFSLLLRPEEDVDITASLVSLGMDSLVAIEMRSWWRQVFGFDVSVLAILDLGAIDALGRYAAEMLLKQHTSDSEEQEDTKAQ